MVALLGRLRPGIRIRIADLARELDTTEVALVADLETLAACGVAPYYPDDLMPLLIEDGVIEVFGELPAVRSAIRLSPGEARALAAALETAGFPAHEGLTARLLAATGSLDFDTEELTHTLLATTSAHASSVYQVLSRCIEEGLLVRIEHGSAGTEVPRCRDVEPLALFAERSAWYVTGWCRDAGGWRTFRVDRILDAVAIDERVDPASRSDAPQASEAISRSDLPRATLAFAPGEHFDERDWPGGRAIETTSDGTVVAEVPFAGTAWIARRVCARLGGVELLRPAEARTAVAKLAGRILSEVERGA
jgi:proteasome accessory factor C